MITVFPAALEFSRTADNNTYVHCGTTVYRLKDEETGRIYRRQFLHCESANAVASILNKRHTVTPSFRAEDIRDHFADGFSDEVSGISDILPQNVRPEYY